MSSKEEVTSSELQDLLHYFAKNTYKARDSDSKVFQTLFESWSNLKLNFVSHLKLLVTKFVNEYIKFF